MARGDCLIWNDVGTLHRATPYDEEKYIRSRLPHLMRLFAAAAMTSDVEVAALQHH